MVLTETKQFGGCVFMTLNDLKIGQSGIITAVGGEGALRLRLLDMGLIQIQSRGYELTIRREDAQRIEIRKEEAV